MLSLWQSSSDELLIPNHFEHQAIHQANPHQPDFLGSGRHRFRDCTRTFRAEHRREDGNRRQGFHRNHQNLHRTHYFPDDRARDFRHGQPKESWAHRGESTALFRNRLDLGVGYWGCRGVYIPTRENRQVRFGHRRCCEIHRRFC